MGDVTESSPDAVPDDGSANLFAGGKSEARNGEIVWSGTHRTEAMVHGLPLSEDAIEVTLPSQAMNPV